MASGAQILSTDYPKAEPAQWTGYSVSFAAGAMARCNPVARNAACSDGDLRMAAQQVAGIGRPGTRTGGASR
jgi:hypothetical protein